MHIDNSMVLSMYSFQSLKLKGVDISGKGVSVKMSGRLDREHMIDATQRAFIKTIGASSFGTADNVGPDDENDGVTRYPDTSNLRMSTRMYRQNSSASASKGSIGKEKKGKKFGKIPFTKST